MTEQDFCYEVKKEKVIFRQKRLKVSTLEFLINVGLRLLILGHFSSPFALIWDPMFIKFEAHTRL